MDEFIMAHIRL